MIRQTVGNTARESIVSRIIFHIDVNSAFLAWSAVEELHRAKEEGRETVDLRTVPAIVGGDVTKRRGIVTAASIPAKKLGIRTAQPVTDAFRLCPDLIVVRGDFGLYRARSRELMELLRKYSPLLQQMSVDECFLDVTDTVTERAASGRDSWTRESAVTLAREIGDRVREELEFTVNIGISSNKVLAKMASDFEKPDKVHTLFPDEIKEKMWPLDVGDLFMAGKASASKLKSLGIMTIGDLARSDPQMLESHLKSHGRTLWDYANGRASDTVRTERERAKSESVERTLPRDCIDLEDAFGHIGSISRNLAGRLYNHGFRAGEVAVLIKYADFTSASRQRKLVTVTGEAGDIEREACALYEELWDGRPVRLIGVRAGKLAAAGDPVQMSLEDFAKERVAGDRRKKADDAVRKLNERFGDGVVRRGAGAE